MSHFASGTVSFGIVCRDINESLAFYCDALGLHEVHTFDVPVSMGGDSGLSDNKAFHVHVLQTTDDETATNVKLMQFPDAPGETVNNDFIHGAYGIRYLTIRVTDIDAALERAATHGVKPIAKGPIELPKGLSPGIYLACVRDPDGNMIELIGPRA